MAAKIRTNGLWSENWPRVKTMEGVLESFIPQYKVYKKTNMMH